MQRTETGDGARRALTALLHTRGTSVRLRVPAPAGSGDAGEELGLGAAAMTELEAGRGVLRKANGTQVLLLGAEAVEQALGAFEAASAEAMFAAAAGAVVGEVLYRIEACNPLRAGDGVYGYALTLAGDAR